MTRIPMMLLALLLVACGGAATPAETTPAADSEPAESPEASASIALPNQVEVEGHVTGGQPTEADLRAAAEAGYRTIITLRMPTEDGFDAERAMVEELGMSFESLPIAGADGITPENAAALDALLSSATGPLVVHCGSGNRVGALFALRAFSAGHSVEESMEIGRAGGMTRLEPTVQERLNTLCAADPERSC